MSDSTSSVFLPAYTVTRRAVSVAFTKGCPDIEGATTSNRTATVRPWFAEVEVSPATGSVARVTLTGPRVRVDGRTGAVESVTVYPVATDPAGARVDAEHLIPEWLHAVLDGALQ